MYLSRYFIIPGFLAGEEASRFGLAGAYAEKSTGRSPVFSGVMKPSHLSCISDLSDPP